MTKTPCFNAFGQCNFADGCDHGTCRHAPMSRTVVPTMGLRWLEREVTSCGLTRIEKVLQQGFAPTGGGQVEWIDVPTVKA